MIEMDINFDVEGFKVKVHMGNDGERWCVIAGDDIQTGIVGFGKSTLQAITNFKSEFRKS